MTVEQIENDYQKDCQGKITQCSLNSPKNIESQVEPYQETKEKVKCNGINKSNCVFKNPITNKDDTKFSYDVFETMYKKSFGSSYKNLYFAKLKYGLL